MSIGTGTIALVTGASSGIGEATVRAFRRRGVEVHAVARRADRLDRLAEETGCVSHVVDVRDREAVVRLADEVPADILVNNAGLGRAMGSLLTADLDDIERTVDTNVTAVIHMTRLVLPGMIERGRGHIVNMSSISALYPIPSALYGATKGAIHNLSRDLRLDLQGTRVRVTEINPGRVSTEFYDVAVDDVEQRALVTGTEMEELQPADIADAVLYAVDAPWRVNISMIEIAPIEQTYGGVHVTPVGPLQDVD